MHLYLLGLNHTTASTELREKVSFSEEELPKALSHINSIDSVMETAVLSTCNRTEIYLAVDLPKRDAQVEDFVKVKNSLINFLTTFKKLDIDLADYIYEYNCEPGTRHLFKVATSLDSLVIGERQILGQVKSAYQSAQANGTTGSLVNKLFQYAVTVGKRARAETRIGEGAVSVSQAAVELSAEIYEDLCAKSVLVVGAGEMGQLAATHLGSKGCQNLTFINRSRDKAERLAQTNNGKVRSLEELPQAFMEADLILTATSSQEFILRKENLDLQKKKKSRSVKVIIDMSVPRDIDPDIGTLENFFLYTVDDLKQVVEKNISKRKAEIERVNKIIQEEFVKYNAWYQKLTVLSTVQKIRSRLEAIRQQSIEQFEKKERKSGRDLENRDLINKITTKMLSKITNDLISGAERCETNREWQEYSEKLADIFGVEV